jgi:lipoprotein NlpI
LIDEKGFNHFYTFLDKLKKNFDEKFLTEHNKQLSDKRWQTILITFITEAIGTKDLENKIQKFKDRIPQMKI